MIKQQRAKSLNNDEDKENSPSLVHSRWKNQAQSLLKNSHFSSFPSLICFFGFLPSAQNSLDPYCEPSKILAPLFMFVSLALQEKTQCVKKRPHPHSTKSSAFFFCTQSLFSFCNPMNLEFQILFPFLLSINHFPFFTPIKISFPTIPSTFFSRNSTQAFCFEVEYAYYLPFE